MKKPAFLIVVALILAGSPGYAGEIKGETQYLIKMATLLPEMGPSRDLVYEMKKELSERTGGRLNLRVYFGGVMGDEPDIVRKIRLGQLQGGMMLTLLGLGQISPAVKVLQLPFLFDNREEVDYVLNMMRPEFARLFEEKGMYFVDWSEIGFGYFFSKDPINNFEDIKKVKMVAFTGDPLFNEAEKVAGFGNLIPLHITETLTGLQTGLIGGTYVPFVGLIALQWAPYAKYVLNVPFSYSPGGAVVDKNFFDRLSPADREVFFDVFRKREREIGFELVRKMEREAYDSLLKRGMIEVEKGKAELIASEMKKRTRPLYEKFEGEYYPAWLLKEVLDRLEEYRAQKGIK
ncbi:MAG: TRAP transporter substrate-binding protein DctP [Proteobacteria bacterium]|nr:TRAP transporter substrate-binding protein DctP [Pseudomonadota bacterium]